MKILTVGAELFRTDLQTDMAKLIVAFHDFCKKYQIKSFMKIRPVGAE